LFYRALWDLYIASHKQRQFLLYLEKFYLHENTYNYRSYMFRTSTILRELVQSLANVTRLLKHSVKLRRCILCGDVTACLEVAFVHSTHAISPHAATSPHNIQRRNFSECFNRSVTLARLCTSSLRMVEDRNM